MSVSARLLGFAFANADFLFEVGADGMIRFAAGATGDLTSGDSQSLLGGAAETLFLPGDATKFADITRRLPSGRRAGPYRLKLAGGMEVDLSVFRLAENGENISCTISRIESAAPGADAQTGLDARDAFLANAGRLANQNDALTLVDVPGLQDLCAGLAPETADQLLAAIGAGIGRSGASAAGRLSDTRFGALAAANVTLDLGGLVSTAIASAGLTPLPTHETKFELDGPGLSSEQRLLTLRYAVEKFAQSGQPPGDNAAQAFAALMQETQQRLLDMTRTVNKSDFQLVYQPIADLVTGKVSHYEALARFANKEGTAQSVQFIEALGIADAFDLAVAAKVLSLMESDARTHYHVAFNVSGRTIETPASFGMLAAILAKNRKLAPRLLIEITETAAIADLESAGKAVASLRALGYRVGLDDFGAGAASVNYLHAFPVDFVKFDGAMIKKIGSSQRDDALLAGLAKLCADMKVTTIAEWIEDEGLAKAARALGFHHGQGRHFGMGTPSIPQEMAVGKRRGIRESWG
jgi:EAL domain-containing protein (putative c-di-GMP-specific phosphodiesterase class I)